MGDWTFGGDKQQVRGEIGRLDVRRSKSKNPRVSKAEGYCGKRESDYGGGEMMKSRGYW